MIFSLQHYIEDYFHRRNLSDVDQYAVCLANCVADFTGEDEVALLNAVHRIRTVFYQNNSHLVRSDFEAVLVRLMRSRYKKKDRVVEFPGGVVEARILCARGRTRMRSIVEDFARAVEARAIDTFWESRPQGRLRKRAEKIGQSLFAVFAKAVLGHRRTGLVLREMYSGVGFVDVGVIIAGSLHLVEIKLIRSSFEGVSQLEAYMKTEDRQRGWLICFEARPAVKRDTIPPAIETPSGHVAVTVVDINPVLPSRRGLGGASI